MPQAGSPTTSVGLGSSISTMRLDDVPRVRNWPLMPAVVSLLEQVLVEVALWCRRCPDGSKSDR
jgi:hypothetical protein